MQIKKNQKRCKTESDSTRFGICDDPPPPHIPAYIEEDNPLKWIAIIHNPKQESVEFYAIDHCVEIVRTDGTMESRCDGLLRSGKQYSKIQG